MGMLDAAKLACMCPCKNHKQNMGAGEASFLPDKLDAASKAVGQL